MIDYGVKNAKTAFNGGSSGSAPAAAGAPLTAGSNKAAVQVAANKHGVPSWLLWGIYGKETRFGQDVATSSAGAEGSFQFLQSTAASEGYPYTNATDPATFAAQADAAALYLSQLKSEFGSWAAAVQHYSGGGYTLADVQSEAAGNPL